MLARVTIAVFLCAFGLVCVGCEGDSKPSNPNNLEYSKDGPPKRDGVKGNK